MRPVFVWLFFLAAILLAAMPHGMRSALVTFSCAPNAPKECVAGKLTPASTNADIIRLYGESDATFIARHAKEYAERHAWAQVTGWPLWPPGMMVIETLLYSLSPALQVGLILLVLGAGFWAGVMTSLSVYLRPMGRFVSLALPLMLLLTVEFQYYAHMGVFYSESLSTSTFMLGCLCLAQAAEQHNAKKALMAGGWLALSAYMRAQTDIVMMLVALLWLACALFCFCKNHGAVQRGWRATLAAPGWLGVLFLALVSYHAVTLPYRAAHGMHWIDMEHSPMWPPTWEYKKDLTPEYDFYVEGGGVEGCDADPVLCADIHQIRKERQLTSSDYFHYTIASVLHHPLEWARLKYPYLKTYWLESPGEGIVLLILLPMIWVVCIRRGDDRHAVLALLLLATMGGIMIPLLLTHFEWRYPYQFKLLILLSVLMMLRDSFIRVQNYSRKEIENEKF